MHLLFLIIPQFFSKDPVDFLFDQVQRQQLKSFVEHRQSVPDLKPFKLSVVADDQTALVQPSPSYEGVGCAAVSSPALRSCQIFAEQTCYNPNIPDAVALTIQSTRLQQLGGAAFQVHASSSCRLAHCDSAACDNPTEPGERDRCVPCLETCNKACLLNVELACLQKVCASAVGSASTSSMFEQREAKDVAEKHALLSRWLKSFIEQDAAGNSLCSASAVMAADTTVIAPGGLTYTAALVGCVGNYFSVDKVKTTISDPTVPLKDIACTVVDKCPRNNAALAFDRAVKMWNDLADIYAARIGN